MDDTFKVPFAPIVKPDTTTTETPLDETSEPTFVKPELPPSDETSEPTFVKPELPPSDESAPVRHKNLQYNVPESSSLPPIEYILEVLRNGSIIDHISLSQRSYTVFGRSPDCDIVLEHQTISRYHAVIQYKSEFEHGQPAGLYLYDCGSTHGTFINKKRLEPKVYVRIKIGYIIKFGQSTRLYIVQGDTEAEAEAIDTTAGDVPTHEQMKLFHAKRAKKIAAVRAKRESAANEGGSDDIEMDWGMGPDVDEAETVTKVVTSHRDDEDVVVVRNDEEIKKRAANDDLKNRLEYKQAKNDQSILKEIMTRVDEPTQEDEEGDSKKEPFYLKDPKRALTAFFEREGAELTYDVEDHQFGSYRCTIKLPIVDEYGRAIQAECEQKHCKRKEIIHQCILEACRILDEHGVLREGTSASSSNIPRVQQIKRQMLEENDFYDEDEDTFYDRTGDLERKRLKRMAWSGHLTEEKQVETFETLCTKLSKLYHEQVELEQKLETAKEMEEKAAENAQKQDNDLDEVDLYIRQLKQGEKVNLKVKFQWKKRLLEIENEERQYAKLLKVCKPKDFNLQTWKQQMREEAKVKLTTKPVSIPRISSSLPPALPPPPLPIEEKPTAPVESTSKPDVTTDPAPVKPKRIRQKIERPPRNAKDQYDDTEHYSEDKFAGWMPPENEQTGDGRTALNEKYGY